MLISPAHRFHCILRILWVMVYGIYQLSPGTLARTTWRRWHNFRWPCETHGLLRKLVRLVARLVRFAEMEFLFFCTREVTLIWFLSTSSDPVSADIYGIEIEVSALRSLFRAIKCNCTEWLQNLYKIVQKTMYETIVLDTTYQDIYVFAIFFWERKMPIKRLTREN